MRKIFSIIIICTLVAGIIPTVGYFILLESLPKINGSTKVLGLKHPVKIIRDSEGVPHIIAQTSDDAYFGLGYVHAQDRLWQMEISRRIGAGRLSEILGEDALIYDKFLRTLGTYSFAKRTYSNLDKHSQSALIAYSAGVNSFLATNNGLLPPEFLVFSHKPEPWQPADSLVWIKVMAFNLGGNMSRELQRAQMARILNPTKISEFFPPHPGDPNINIPDFSTFYSRLPLQPLASMAHHYRASGNGSNNFAVSGAHTVTGKPLLANDPHLSLSVPSVWYLAHLKAPGLNVIGATLPGVPLVVLGHNDHIAWGFTNTNPDVQDLYIERIVPGTDDRYLTPTGEAIFQTRQEIIHVDGKEDVKLDVRTTRHGPVISDVFPDATDVAPEDHVIALAWTALRDDDLTFQAGIKISHATNWMEFVEALRDYHSPQQNIVYADVDNNIGFIAPGRVPIRNSENIVSGLMPVPGWKSLYDWVGFIPYDELPRYTNPPSGKIYSSNNKIVENDYPYFLTYDWEPPYRARRLEELLDEKEKHSIDTFSQIQSDNLSLMATDLLPPLIATTPRESDTASALDLLSKWDGRMLAERPEPLLFISWMRELSRLIYRDELNILFPKYWTLKGPFLHRVLTEKTHWCDDTLTTKEENCTILQAKALKIAISDLTTQYKSAMEEWRWGDAHLAKAEHNPFSRVPLLNLFFGLTGPMPGGEYTLNRGGHRINSEKTPFAAIHGSSYRAIYDLSNLDNSLFIQSTGQSGNIFSSQYSRYFDRWRNTEYVAMKTSPVSIANDNTGILSLLPQ